MELNKLSICASDLGLADLEIFLRPELLEKTSGQDLMHFNFGYSKKVTMGALVLLLNTPLKEVVAQPIVINTNNQTSYSDIQEVITKLDVEATILENEVETVLGKSKGSIRTEKDILEEDIIDAYIVEMGALYRKNKKVSL